MTEKIVKDVIVSGTECGWKKSMNQSREEFLFNFASMKVYHMIDNPDFPWGDNWSMYVTLMRKRIYRQGTIKHYPFRIVIKPDKKEDAVLSFVNLRK
ncbi:MAG: hypothetical protein U9Q92_01325 [archaeon]|nr:hypothetical protein [archaeon]